MLDLTNTNNQIQLVATFKELVDSSFVGHGAQPTLNLIKYYEMEHKIPTNRNE
jgi:hypothetical protein